MLAWVTKKDNRKLSNGNYSIKYKCQPLDIIINNIINNNINKIIFLA